MCPACFRGIRRIRGILGNRSLRSEHGILAALSLAAFGFASFGAAQQATSDPGHEVFDKWCTPCHGAGPGKPGTMVLAQRYGTTRPALLEERTDLTSEYLETFVRQGVGVMPQFRKTEITDAELAAMIEYLLR